MNQGGRVRSFRTKRRSPLVAAVVALSLVAAACGSDDPTTEAPDDARPSDEAYRVAVLTVGSASDSGFGSAWAAAADNADQLDGVEVEFVAGLATPDEYEAQGAAFASDGFDLIVVAHGGMSPVGLKLAAQFPDVTICVAPVPGTPEEELPSNSCFFDVEQQIGAFRSGVLAASLTETDIVAVVHAFDFPAVTRQVEAFKLGARCVNPEITVVSELTNDDTDQALAKAATESLIQQGADIVMGTHSAATAGIFQAAAQTPGTFAIGQYVDSQESAPEVVLASNIANFQDVFPAFVEQAKAGELPASHFESFGIDSTVEVGLLAENSELLGTFPEEALNANNAIQQRITDGEIVVPDTASLDTVGKSDSIDPASIGCEIG